MVVCTFFQQGRCKFGDRCKYEHPGRGTTGASGNRFGALSGGGLGGQQRGSAQEATDYGVTANDIKLDLSVGKGRPEWVFSSYAPSRNAPRQLFGGPQREQSMEEMRLRHYELAAAGNLNQAVQEAQTLWQESVRQMESALNDLNGAVKYIIDGANEHPNRLDIIEQSQSAGGSETSAVGQFSTAQAVGAFGAPAAPAAGWGKPSGVGQPTAFSQASTQQQAPAAGFGQPSALGQSSPFGQPSALGQASGFGQPSQMGQGSAFGQPSSLGASAQTTFGQPAFGQPGFASAVAGQSQRASDVFGALSKPSPFGQSPTSQPAPSAGGFGNSGPFGQPSQSASPFGQLAQPQQPPSAPAPFGQPSAPPNPFGAPSTQPQQSAAAPSPFGQPAAPQGLVVPNVNAGPRAFFKIDTPNELNPLPPLEGDTRRDPATNRLVLWKGRPVTYIKDAPCYLHPQDNKTPVRINFPDGPPDDASLRDSQAKPEEYTPEVEAMFRFFLDNGYFKDGKIPSVAPRKDFISFDF
ncbi:hypothetical protein N7539_009248 [Penicillium diatomitis]|uniref:C3H1-type domain-containing protein n=1 Tax=Penicillium diatomitis TaxID=2819901 RepID=A0A9W9WLE9_9EURO|nr:uncharacterized protein N7539_009248 [Penicillium diatomitis]KAJ5469630.1 hypothetical protein N7539_009248 [Penicillium diatomitis]